MEQVKSIVMVYTGDGKGKTTAAIGQLMRALGAGWRVGLVRLLKDKSSSEMAILTSWPELKIITASPQLKGFYSDLSAADQQLVLKQSLEALAQAGRWIKEAAIDLLILDEIVVTIELGIISETEILRLFAQAREQGIDLVLTGRHASAQLQEAADLVTEMQEVKHPFHQGYPARRGIDY